MRSGMSVDPLTCMCCGSCVGICPKLAISIDGACAAINSDCDGCGLCARGCPVGAIHGPEGVR